MKKVFSIIMMLLLVLGSTGAVFAAEDGVDALADEKNPAFEVYSMDEMGMVILVNNDDLHFSLDHGHIMIPGDISEYNDSPVFVTMEHHDGSHLAPSGRIKLFDHDME